MRTIRDEDRERGSSHSVTIEGVRAVHTTEKAVLCDIPDHGEVWIPQWAITDDSEVWQRGDEGKLVIAAKVARDKGLD